ncbi:MAG: Dabb family protein [Chloroflexi bacterium]|nr:Dabb family protein [Chloroflexota bacterium]
MSLTGAQIITFVDFNLKADITEVERKEIIDACHRMARIRGVMGVAIGPNWTRPPRPPYDGLIYKHAGVIFHTNRQTFEEFHTHPLQREFFEKYLIPNLEQVPPGTKANQKNPVINNLQIKYHAPREYLLSRGPGSPSIGQCTILHHWLFNFKPGVTEEQKEMYFRIGSAIEHVPGVIAAEFGPNLSGDPYQYTGVFYHLSEETQRAYVTHPIHRYFVDNYQMPLIEDEDRITINTMLE